MSYDAIMSRPCQPCPVNVSSTTGVGRAEEADHCNKVWSDIPTSTTSASGAFRSRLVAKHQASRREAIVEPVGLTAFITSARSSRILRSSTKYTGSARVATMSSSSCHRFDLSVFWSGQSVAVLMSQFWHVAVLVCCHFDHIP